MTKPIVHLFKLGIEESNKHIFHHAGVHNLTKQVKYEVEPLFLKEKLSSQQCIEPNQYLLKFAQIEIKEDQQDTFEERVLMNMKASMSEEEDVLAMYALRDVHQHNKYYFYEVYQNEQAYEAHCETTHFKNYIRQTKDILNDKKLYNLENDVFITQGNLRFK